jgi:hypothetical protein
VSTTFSLFLNDMGLYPDIQQRLRSEIEAKRIEIGGEDAIFTQEDYDSMPYLNAVLKVSLSIPHSPRCSLT